MGDVVETDFNKELNEARRNMARLLRLVDSRDAEYLKDPKKFFKLASDRILELELKMEEARNALRMPLQGLWVDENTPIENHPQTIRLHKDTYERMKRCAQIVEGWDDT